MRTIMTIAGATMGLCLLAGPAYAIPTVPEPVSMSLFAGGAAVIAAVRMMRRK